jgi:UDP-glucose 4-epimerase
MRRIFVTGAAGFSTGNLVDRLLQMGDEVGGWGNFSTGQHESTTQTTQSKRYGQTRGDNLEMDHLTESMEVCDLVHLAANADVRFGLNHPRKDLEQNTLSTFLKAGDALGARRSEIRQYQF